MITRTLMITRSCDNCEVVIGAHIEELLYDVIRNKLLLDELAD